MKPQAVVFLNLALVALVAGRSSQVPSASVVAAAGADLSAKGQEGPVSDLLQEDRPPADDKDFQLQLDSKADASGVVDVDFSGSNGGGNSNPELLPSSFFSAGPGNANLNAEANTAFDTLGDLSSSSVTAGHGLIGKVEPVANSDVKVVEGVVHEALDLGEGLKSLEGVDKGIVVGAQAEVVKLENDLVGGNSNSPVTGVESAVVGSLSGFGGLGGLGDAGGLIPSGASGSRLGKVNSLKKLKAAASASLKLPHWGCVCGKGADINQIHGHVCSCDSGRQEECDALFDDCKVKCARRRSRSTCIPQEEYDPCVASLFHYFNAECCSANQDALMRQALASIVVLGCNFSNGQDSQTEVCHK